MKQMKITEITPYEKNAKKHDAFQVEQIAKSIKRFGFNQPLVVDKAGVIIVGHGRFEAAKQLELKEVPVIVLDIPEKDAKAYRLADNKLNESEWDYQLVIDELKGLDDPELVDLTGFEKDILVEPDEKDDNAPDLPEKTSIKKGDMYQLGQHRIVCGDSTDHEVVKRLFGEQKADLLLTDPPYNVDYEGKTKKKLKIENDKKSDDDYQSLLIMSFENAKDVLKAGGVFYIWHADSEGFAVRTAMQTAGLEVRQCLIWEKDTMVMGRQDYHWQHEPCLYGWKEGAGHLWNADRKQTTILRFARPSRSEAHPTMKPVELLVYQMTNNTKGEDIVFDPFLGSGSTLIAAEKTGRICYGVELDPKYVDVIIQRWEEYTGGKAEKV